MKNNFYIRSSKNNCYHFAVSTGLYSVISPILYDVATLFEHGYKFQILLDILSKKYKKTEIKKYIKLYSDICKNHTIDDTKCTKLLNKEMIEDAIINLQQLTIEVTNSCNLRCKYCGYGELYDNYDPRNGEKMSIDIVRSLIDYLVPLWQEHVNNQPIYISFYGGEPLLNFKLIKEIVEIFDQLKCSRRFVFSMTTNGVLLLRYIDFLVLHDFKLLISLDGNEFNNSYRVKKDGTPSYSEVINNVMWIKHNYNEYYLNSINFNAVFHDRSNVSDVINFFKIELEKVPRLSSLNTSGVKESRKEKFNAMYKDLQVSVDQIASCKKSRDIFQIDPKTREFNLFTHQLNQFVYSDFNDFFKSYKEIEIIPTGTCVPFSKKMYLTVTGKLLPCERIGQSFEVGRIVDGKLQLDLDKIVDKYNKIFQKVSNICSSCYRKRMCSQCIFHMQQPNNKIVCNGYLDESSFTEYLKTMIDRMEDNPNEYQRTMKEVIIR